ncbi:MAG: molybdate ABC transporter substrate-binding protein [Rhizobiaceae bacterium]
MRFARKVGVAALGFAALISFGAAKSAIAGDNVTVFAAASLKNAMDAVNEVCAAEVGGKATISYAGSSTLAKQIEQGAPADVFMSANLDWMTYLADRGLIREGTEVQLLGNSIVLIAPVDSTTDIEITQGFDLSGVLGDGRLAMANVDAVPAGKYGKAALETLGVWSAVESKVAQADNVRAALALVSSGEAPLGIVYKTDAAADKNVKVIGTFPEDTHPPIVYPVALVAESENGGATKFLSCLQTSKAKVLFEEQGFTVLAK